MQGEGEGGNPENSLDWRRCGLVEGNSEPCGRAAHTLQRPGRHPPMLRASLATPQELKDQRRMYDVNGILFNLF